jgi:nucleoside phosphorylase
MFAMIGSVTGEILSYRGRMVLHDNRAELEWLFPGVRVAELPGNTVEQVAHRYGRPAMLLRHHPDMAPVRWPLDRRDFRS